ncbi:hypothetical protein NDA03_20190 [Trichocoleus sp. Lan]|uniref:hypothetical protein n=1 Tax=unclassified Trichocoleus TaxID=2628910 RepID=UPI003297FEA5
MNRFKLATWKVAATTAVLGLIAIGGSIVYFKDGILSASAQLVSQATPSPAAKSDMDILGAQDGLIWGTATLDDSARSGVLQYSVARVGATGYFYGSYQDPEFPETYFANLVQPSACGAGKAGYKGFQSIAEINDISKLTYTTTKSILVGDKESGCYTGLLVIRQETQEKDGKFFYMVIEPIDVDNTSLKVRWWANVKTGVTDFSKAPKTF